MAEDEIGFERAAPVRRLVRKLSVAQRGPTKANGLCGERKRSGCGWMFPERGTEQSNTCADEARGRIHVHPDASRRGVDGCGGLRSRIFLFNGCFATYTSSVSLIG